MVSAFLHFSGLMGLLLLLQKVLFANLPKQLALLIFIAFFFIGWFLLIGYVIEAERSYKDPYFKVLGKGMQTGLLFLRKWLLVLVIGFLVVGVVSFVLDPY